MPAWWADNTWLLLGVALNRYTLRGDATPPDDRTATADAATATFLARYGPAEVTQRP